MKKPNKVYLIPVWLLASLGIGINSAYYYESFVQAGYTKLFPLALSVALMLFELVVWLYRVDRWFIYVLRGLLIILSISATLGSQFFSTSERETNIEEAVFKELDHTGEIEYLREQIKIQQDLIKSYTRSQEENFIFTLTKDKQSAAESKISGYEEEIKILQGQKSSAVLKINKPQSIYYFYSHTIPRILQGESKEELIRVIFQLLYSIIIALIAPVSFYIIKSYSKTKVLDQPTKDNPLKNKYHDDKKNILKVLLHGYDGKQIMTPDRAVSVFEQINKGDNTRKVYKLKECQIVHDFIHEAGLIGKDKKIIIEGVLNG